MNFRLKHSKYCYDTMIESLFIEPNELKLYPNPTQFILNITISQRAGLVSYLDAKGLVVQSQEIEAGITAINVSSLTVGVYFIQNAGTIWKFIKQ